MEKKCELCSSGSCVNTVSLFTQPECFSKGFLQGEWQQLFQTTTITDHFNHVENSEACETLLQILICHEAELDHLGSSGFCCLTVIHNVAVGE